MSTGIIEITDADSSVFQSIENCPLKFEIASCKVYFLGSLITNNGQIKSFHLHIKEKIVRVDITDFAIGTINRQKIVRSLAPSILADSNMESGTDKKYCLIKNIPVGVAIGGIIIPHSELYSPNLLTTVNVGDMITSVGSMVVDRNATKSKSLPLNLYFANAKPAIVFMANVIMVDVTVTMKVFLKYNKKSYWLNVFI